MTRSEREFQEFDEEGFPVWLTDFGYIRIQECLCLSQIFDKKNVKRSEYSARNSTK